MAPNINETSRSAPSAHFRISTASFTSSALPTAIPGLRHIGNKSCGLPYQCPTLTISWANEKASSADSITAAGFNIQHYGISELSFCSLHCCNNKGLCSTVRSHPLKHKSFYQQEPGSGLSYNGYASFLYNAYKILN